MIRYIVQVGSKWSRTLVIWVGTPTCPSVRPSPSLPTSGDVSSGKSTLVDRLCQISKSYPIGGRFPLSGCSLEYRFIDVQDEETDGEGKEGGTHTHIHTQVKAMSTI